jgi:hypothetical protein
VAEATLSDYPVKSPLRSRTLPLFLVVLNGNLPQTRYEPPVITGTTHQKRPSCRANMTGRQTKGLSRPSRMSPPRSETFPLQNRALNGICRKPVRKRQLTTGTTHRYAPAGEQPASKSLMKSARYVETMIPDRVALATYPLGSRAECCCGF